MHPTEKTRQIWDGLRRKLERKWTKRVGTSRPQGWSRPHQLNQVLSLLGKGYPGQGPQGSGKPAGGKEGKFTAKTGWEEAPLSSGQASGYPSPQSTTSPPASTTKKQSRQARFPSTVSCPSTADSESPTPARCLHPTAATAATATIDGRCSGSVLRGGTLL